MENREELTASQIVHLQVLPIQRRGILPEVPSLLAVFLHQLIQAYRLMEVSIQSLAPAVPFPPLSAVFLDQVEPVFWLMEGLIQSSAAPPVPV